MSAFKFRYLISGVNSIFVATLVEYVSSSSNILSLSNISGSSYGLFRALYFLQLCTFFGFLYSPSGLCIFLGALYSMSGLCLMS